MRRRRTRRPRWGGLLVGLALLGGLLPGAGRAQGVPGGLGDEQRIAGLPGGQVTELHLAGPYLVWSVVTAQAVPGPPGTPGPNPRPAPPVQQADLWWADLRVTPPHPQHLAGPLPPATRVSLAGSLVVWSDSSGGRASAIVGRDVATNAPITAPPMTGNQFLPAASGDWVVWSGSPNQTGAGIPEAQAITAWNRRTGELRTLDTYWLEPDPQRGPAPAVDGTQVAAIVRPMDGSTRPALRLYDLATGTVRAVLTFPDEAYQYSNLHLAGGWAVWEEPTVGPQGEAAARIVQVNLTDGKQYVRAEAARAGTLAAGSGGVAWRDLAEGTPLVAYPLNPQSEIAVRTLTPPQARPRGPVALSADGVAWVDGRDSAAPAIYVRQAGGVPPPASDPFTRLWTRTDEPVAAGRVARSWVWGPRPEGLLARDRQEPYAEAPGLQRLVRYYDKGRMEINDPGANLEAPWAITSGLLVVEMVTGRVATGNTAAATMAPNPLPVAGDPDSPATPPYAALAGAMINPQSERPLPGPRSGEPVTTWMDRAGTLSEHPAPALVRYAAYDETAHHNIPDVFLAFMTQRGLVNEGGTYREDALFDPLFTFGYPLIEPVWITIRVGGQDRAVLFQAFERRTLTYTPSNAPAWQVEMGNVGAHYYAWRYER